MIGMLTSHGMDDAAVDRVLQTFNVAAPAFAQRGSAGDASH
jgi:hypothetical protein